MFLRFRPSFRKRYWRFIHTMIDVLLEERWNVIGSVQGREIGLAHFYAYKPGLLLLSDLGLGTEEGKPVVRYVSVEVYDLRGYTRTERGRVIIWVFFCCGYSSYAITTHDVNRLRNAIRRAISESLRKLEEARRQPERYAVSLSPYPDFLACVLTEPSLLYDKYLPRAIVATVINLILAPHLWKPRVVSP